MTAGAAATATLVFLVLLLLRAFRKPSDAESTRPSTGTIWAWAVLAVALTVAAVLVQKPSTGLVVSGIMDDVWEGAANVNAYYAPRVYKMKI